MEENRDHLHDLEFIGSGRSAAGDQPPRWLVSAIHGALGSGPPDRRGEGQRCQRVGFRAIPWRDFVWVSAINLGGSLLVALLFEPWSHTYQMLVKAAISNRHPDTTFAWLLRLPRLPALGAMFLYSGTVTLFGEELFFRGWLLQLLQKRWGMPWAIIAQAALFTLPNLLASLALPAPQGILYASVYTFLAIGLIGGWAAARTKSIWPSLFSATLCNLASVVLTI